jgi:hypothetical protein
MFYRPRGLLFWLLLIILLFIIAVAPVDFAQAVMAAGTAVGRFFVGLRAFLETLTRN